MPNKKEEKENPNIDKFPVPISEIPSNGIYLAISLSLIAVIFSRFLSLFKSIWDLRAILRKIKIPSNLIPRRKIKFKDEDTYKFILIKMVEFAYGNKLEDVNLLTLHNGKVDNNGYKYSKVSWRIWIKDKEPDIIQIKDLNYILDTVWKKYLNGEVFTIEIGDQVNYIEPGVEGNLICYLLVLKSKEKKDVKKLKDSESFKELKNSIEKYFTSFT